MAAKEVFTHLRKSNTLHIQRLCFAKKWIFSKNKSGKIQADLRSIKLFSTLWNPSLVAPGCDTRWSFKVVCLSDLFIVGLWKTHSSDSWSKLPYLSVKTNLFNWMARENRCGKFVAKNKFFMTQSVSAKSIAHLQWRGKTAEVKLI